ncbi:MAG: AbrB/MazE/SpoVT family DNA-binding domain-containing protein [Anaerolineales bacterium]
MLLRLSSKGQVVLPKPIRDKLRLKTGDQLFVQLIGGKIVLEPETQDMIEKLRGILAGSHALDALEEEHRQEVENDRKLSA